MSDVGPAPAINSPAVALRSTQRAPRSCTRCSRLKIRCDQNLPCNQCIKKNVEGSCGRETVLVRGAITIAPIDGQRPTYDELLADNERLRNAAKPSITQSRSVEISNLDHECDIFERRLFENVPQATICSSIDPNRILFPTPACSTKLIEYDKTWNSWVHYAVQYPDFDREHDLLLARLTININAHEIDASWLALYFAVLTVALLTMDDNEIAYLSLPMSDVDLLLRIWFDTSLHYLHLSDFLRRDNIHTVQTIAVLGICFNNLGEHKLYKNLWSCAIRMAQGLGLDRPVCTELSISPESCRRLWWTLIICEWLSVPWHPPCVTEDDFDMPLPQPEFEPAMVPKTGHRIAPCSPVDYHIFMIRVSSLYQRFRRKLRSSEANVLDLVREADNQLAQVISNLPSHLQPDEPRNHNTRQRDEMYPWVSWQRVYLTLVLLYHRMVINRTLQSKWLIDQQHYSGPRAICLSSARGLLSIQRGWTMSLAKRRQWAPTVHTYAAAACLIRDFQAHPFSAAAEDQGLIDYAITYLVQLQSTSAVAKRAVEILQQVSDDQMAVRFDMAIT